MCRVPDPVSEPLSLVVVTAGDVRRVWPDAPARTRNHSLAALNVRALDFLYDNRYGPQRPDVAPCGAILFAL